jgi:hypothetical protein
MSTSFGPITLSSRGGGVCDSTGLDGGSRLLIAGVRRNGGFIWSGDSRK